jgi:hypothetical protein
MKITVFWDATLCGLVDIYQKIPGNLLPSSSGENAFFYSEDGSRNSDAEVNRITMNDFRPGFGLDIGFIDHLQVVTTNNYNTIAIFTVYKITLSFPARNIFTSSCLVTAL